jgi:hypothetical protein
MANDIMQHEFFKKKVIVTSIPPSAQHTDPEIVELDPPVAAITKPMISPSLIPPVMPSASHRGIQPSPRSIRNLMTRPDPTADLVKRTSMLRISSPSTSRAPIPEMWTGRQAARRGWVILA